MVKSIACRPTAPASSTPAGIHPAHARCTAHVSARAARLQAVAQDLGREAAEEEAVHAILGDDGGGGAE
eukprot:5523690-Prymnesium_polylepis.1